MKRVIQTAKVLPTASGRVVTGSPGKLWQMVCAVCLLGVVTLAACNENPLDSGFPKVQIIMDSLEYGRAPITGEAWVTFLIANRGPGIAYFDGCPDPINMVIEEYREVDDTWVETDRPNACMPGEIPDQAVLDVDEAYEYTLVWEDSGLYRIRVFYGDEATVTTGHFADSPEYAVR